MKVGRPQRPEGARSGIRLNDPRWWIGRPFDFASGLVRLVVQNWFLVAVSFWTAAVYAERIVVDVMIRKERSFAASLSYSPVVAFLLVESLLVLWAFTVKENDVRLFRTWLRRLLRESWTGIWCIGGMFLFVSYKLSKAFIQAPATPVSDLLRNFWREISDDVGEATYVIGALIFLLAFYWLLSRLLKGAHPIRASFREWTLSSVFVGLGAVIYVIFYHRWVFDNVVEPNLRFEIWKGLIKDASTYTLVAFVIVQGLYRYRICCGTFREVQNAWLGYVAIVAPASVLAGLALAFDLRFLDDLRFFADSQFPNAEYTDPRMYPILRWHVLIRDWLMLLPFLIVMFVWLGGELAGAWNLVGVHLKGKSRNQRGHESSRETRRSGS